MAAAQHTLRPRSLPSGGRSGELGAAQGRLLARSFHTAALPPELASLVLLPGQPLLVLHGDRRPSLSSSGEAAPAVMRAPRPPPIRPPYPNTTLPPPLILTSPWSRSTSMRSTPAGSSAASGPVGRGEDEPEVSAALMLLGRRWGAGAASGDEGEAGSNDRRRGDSGVRAWRLHV
jgi:hypothetical protein